MIILSPMSNVESQKYFFRHRSDHCLATEYVIQSITNAFAEGVTWISQSCSIYLSKLSNVFIALCLVTFIVLIVEFYFSFLVMIDVFFMRQNTPPRRQENFWQRTLNFHKLHSKQYEKVFLEIRKHNLRNMKNSVLPIIQFDLLWKSRGRILLLCVSQVIFLTSGKWRVACLSFVASHHTAPNILFAANPNISFFQIKYVFHMIKASFVLKQNLWNL